MAAEEQNVIGLRFGVKGGSEITGDSGDRIKKQLEAIASQINLEVAVKVKTPKGGNDAITRNVKQQKDAISDLERQLNEIAKMGERLNKMPLTSTGEQATVQGALLKEQLQERKKAYMDARIEAWKVVEAEEEGSEEIRKQLAVLDERNSKLKNAFESQPAPKLATPTDLAKLGLKAQSLYTDNGFDKVIARSQEAMQLVNDYNDKVKLVLDNPDSATKDQVAALNKEFLKTETQLKEIGARTNTVGNKLKEAFGSHVIQSLASKAWLLVITYLKQVYTNVVEINKAMTELQIVTMGTSEQMVTAMKNIADSAQAIGSSMSDLIRSTAVFARLGYTLEQARGLAESTTKYANVTGVNVSEATTNITGAIKAYDLDVDQLESTLDKFIWVGNKFAISQAEIGEAMNNAAASLRAGGNSMDEAMAILAAANASVQDISKSSTGVRTLVARINESEAELIALGEDAGDVVSRAKLDEIMRGFGVAITDANGELRSTYDILNDLSKVWGNLTTLEKSSIGEMFAGKRQREVFESIMNNWGDARKVVDGIAESTGALAEAQGVYLDSIEGKTQKLKSTWESFSTNILNSDIIKLFLNLLTWAAEGLNAISGNSIGEITLTIVALKTLVTMFDKLSDKMGDVIFKGVDFSLNLEKTDRQSKSLAQTLKAVADSALGVTAAFAVFMAASVVLDHFGGTAANVAKVVVGAITAITAAIMAFNVSNPFGWVALAISGVMMAIQGIKDVVHANSLDGLIEKAKEARDAWEEAKNELAETEEQIKKLQEAIDALGTNGKLSFIEEADKARLEQELAYLEQIKKAQEETAAVAQREAMTAAGNAIDKYARTHKLDWLTPDSLKIYAEDDGSLVLPGDKRKEVLDAITQYQELLSGFEYGGNERLNEYFETLYRMTDIYTLTTEGISEAWEDIQKRVKFKDAVDSLQKFANKFASVADITQEELEKLQNEEGVEELFDYLAGIGMWDGSNWGIILNIITQLREGLTKVAAISITDDIEAITDKFDALSKGLEDVAKNGILSLDSIKTLTEKYPSLLREYFDMTPDGYKIAEKYKDYSNFGILETLAVSDLEAYRNALEKAQETFDSLEPGDYDYEAALKNLATAQDNLNNKELEWASILREAKIEEETDKLEARKEQLENQLDIYKELIDIRKDLLQTYKEEVDYQKELAKKQKAVADIQTQLTIARLDRSAAGQARARELESQLQEAQDELDEYTLEKAVQDITDSLDSEYSEYESFIKELTEQISDDITNIAKTLELILSFMKESEITDTQHTSTEMTDLYLDLLDKQSRGMASSEATSNFMSSVASKNWGDADTYYEDAKTAADEYTKSQGSQGDANGNGSEDNNEQASEDELIAKQIVKIKGAWGSGIKASKEGDNGIVTFNQKTYQVENAGQVAKLENAAYSHDEAGHANGVGSCFDRDIFYYKGGHGFESGLYGCIDGSVVRLGEQSGWDRYLFGIDKKANGFEALERDIKAAGIYHTGGFVGDLASLRSNEEFAKLLKGELVTTPKQMDDFMRRTLPTMVMNGAGGGATINNNSPLIEINCGSVDNDTLPKLKDLVNEAVKKIGQNMESALHRAGYKKQF